MKWNITKLEPGMMVKCIENPNRNLGSRMDCDGYGAKWKLGDIFEIERIEEKNNIPYIIWNDENGVYADCVEPI